MRWLEEARDALRAALIGGGATLAVASVLPFAETNVWWIRALDFPRLQYALGLIVVGVLYLILGGPRRIGGWLVVVAMTVAAVYNVYKLFPYMSPMPPMAAGVEACPIGSRLRLLIANVQMGSREAEALIEIVARNQPDLFLAMETDAWWDRQLAVLAPLYPYRVQHVDENYFGMHLFSKHPLGTPEVLFPVSEDVPAIFTDLQLPDGTWIDFYGIHPRPPTAFQPSTYRDAQILMAALEARDAPHPTVVAGDLNAVPWERVVRRALRVGGLLDPRVGRGYFPTYDVKAPPVIRWPLDHVLFQDELALVEYRLPSAFGSDHLPVLAVLCRAPGIAAQQSAPALGSDDLAEAEQAIEAGLRAVVRQQLFGGKEG
jgi:endonuclease/exonuclease/phosphatase (EEP) superfamily protein YafD